MGKSDILIFGLIAVGLGVAAYAGYKIIGGIGSLFPNSEGVDLLGGKTKLDLLGNIPKGTQEANIKTSAEASAANVAANQDDYNTHLAYLDIHPEVKANYDTYLKELGESDAAAQAYQSSNKWNWLGQPILGPGSAYDKYLKELKEAQAAYATLQTSIARANGG